MAGWIHAVLADLGRHWRHFAAASVGIVLGVAALCFFLALGFGIREHLLVQVFPEDFIEVERRSADIDIFALRLDLGSDTLDEAVLADLRSVDGVKAVYPKMRLTVPALASGGSSLFGAGLQTEVVADGIDPRLVADDFGGVFREVDDERIGRPCRSGSECGDGSYCDARGVCRPFVPVLVSPYVVELYNGGFRRSYGLPKINPDALTGLAFEVEFGRSTFRSNARPPIRERMRLVGVSDQAIPLGITLPLGEVRRLNATLGSAKAADEFHSAVVELRSREAAARVVETVEDMGLEVRDRGARRAASAIAVVTLLLALVGGVLIAVAGAHIMHVFFMVVAVRRREIGLLRAVGARRSDVRRMLVSEAVVVGLLAGVVGVIAALAAAAMVDFYAANEIPDFPFKPDSFFEFSPWLIAAMLALAIGACILGAIPPAIRAASGDPSDALAGR